ncbi:MAG: hypothetical protein LBK27_06280, partial [Treponema sp.]|nr:hypothetical protein [Treponema sp.]
MEAVWKSPDFQTAFFCAGECNTPGAILDLFNNPVGYRGLKSDTSLAKCSAFLLLLSGSCLKTEVFK